MGRKKCSNWIIIFMIKSVIGNKKNNEYMAYGRDDNAGVYCSVLIQGAI